MSRRLNRHKQPPYDFRDVPDCDRNLEGSCVVRVQSRPHWFSCIGELVHICNEAVRRQGERKGYQGRSTKDTGKPLSLFYIADSDDPIRGYMVRSRKTGWLQGFIITTTFTTWQRWFRWNSVDTHAGILDKNGFVRASNSGRKVDASGELAMELNKQSHHGDPKKEGIIWPKVAEISLLGALGCGGWLVQLILQEMEASAEYEWVVLQALENSIGFYERMGFTRVGAIAKNFEEDQAQNGNNCKRGVTIAYRHWTWDNENVKTLPKPSYMMAKKIKHKTKCSNAPTADRTQELKRKANRGKRRQGLPMKVKSKTPSRLEQLENLLVKRAPAVKVTKKKITSTPDSALKERSRIKTSRRDESTEDDDELKTEYLWAWECAVPKETLEKHLNGEDIEASDEDDKDENNDDDNGDRAGNDSKNQIKDDAPVLSPMVQTYRVYLTHLLQKDMELRDRGNEGEIANRLLLGDRENEEHRPNH
eukprot:CAMPEP_0114501938 /NCGR_PEP_ID=MMETSP0109-20121206/8774_1 /TAXON_ID=29199 /ORGANISM="Chlorarachnion reptans, Strain CCCM449" /LENGTH=476 /DNA_ID=CAMNT_0001679719 /DNA_START=52 /DNA_END=1483 /DNA_ORIENTATION=+